MSAAVAVSAETQAGRRAAWNLTEGMARETAACAPPCVRASGQGHADGGDPRLGELVVDGETALADDAQILQQPGQVSVPVTVELGELRGVQRRKQRLAARRVLGRQDPAGPVPHPQQLVTFHRGGEADLGSDPHHQVRRFIDLGHQDLQVGPGHPGEYLA